MLLEYYAPQKCAAIFAFFVAVASPSQAIYCQQHQVDGMVEIVIQPRRCATKDCDAIARYGEAGASVPKFCSKHAKVGTVDVTVEILGKKLGPRKRCVEQGCTRFPTFGFEGDKTSTFCREHAREGTVDVTVKEVTCAEGMCHQSPIYGVHGGTVPFYCSKHAEPGMEIIPNDRNELTRMGQDSVRATADTNEETAGIGAVSTVDDTTPAEHQGDSPAEVQGGPRTNLKRICATRPGSAGRDAVGTDTSAVRPSE